MVVKLIFASVNPWTYQCEQDISAGVATINFPSTSLRWVADMGTSGSISHC